MNKKVEFWSAHVAAVKQEAISTSAYARQHGLSVKSLYRWQRVLHSGVGVTQPASAGPSFVAVLVATPTVAPVLSGCTVIVSSGLRIDMATLPAPQWLAALAHAVQGAR
jgi:transposase